VWELRKGQICQTALQRLTRNRSPSVDAVGLSLQDTHFVFAALCRPLADRQLIATYRAHEYSYWVKLVTRKTPYAVRDPLVATLVRLVMRELIMSEKEFPICESCGNEIISDANRLDCNL